MSAFFSWGAVSLVWGLNMLVEGVGKEDGVSLSLRVFGKLFILVGVVLLIRHETPKRQGAA